MKTETSTQHEKNFIRAYNVSLSLSIASMCGWERHAYTATSNPPLLFQHLYFVLLLTCNIQIFKTKEIITKMVNQWSVCYQDIFPNIYECHYWKKLKYLILKRRHHIHTLYSLCLIFNDTLSVFFEFFSVYDLIFFKFFVYYLSFFFNTKN